MRIRFYFAAYLINYLNDELSHGNIWCEVPAGQVISIQGLKKSICDKFEAKMDQVTIISFQEICKKQYLELNGN